MLKGYDEYQEVDSNWLDKLPDNWQFLPLQSQLQERKEKNDKNQTNFILSLTAAVGVIPYSEKKTGGNKAKDDITKYNIAHENDLIVNCMNVVAGSSGMSKYYGAISPVYYALFVRNEVSNIRYWEYIFRNKKFYSSLIGLGNGIMMKKSSTGKLNTVRKRIPMNKLNRVMLPVPPKAEQDQIVRYLDWKVSEMNHFIHEKKKQIRHLEELRKIKISQIATRGIHEDVEMKESGLDWLGDIPKHWSVTRVRNNYTLQNGISESGAFFDKGSPFVNYSDVYKNRILPTEFTDVANSSKQQQETFSVRKGDIFFTRTSETIDEIGIASICLHDVPKAVFSGFLIRARAKSEQLDPEYVGLYLQSQCVRNYFTKEMNLVIRASLGQNLLKSLYIPIPPKDEQREIVEYLYKVLDDFDCMISNIRKEISLVEELRVKTIADVVTGQIDVRNVIIPEYTVDEADEDFDSDDIDDGSEESDEDEE